MIRIVLVLLALVAAPLRASADEPDPPTLEAIPAGTHRLSEYLWVARPLVIFADSPADPRFIKQMDLLAEDPAALIARDVVVLIDTDPAAKSPLREALRPRGFDLVLIGKDGLKYLRKPMPWRLREIIRSIDKMPLRLEEMKERRGLIGGPQG